MRKGQAIVETLLATLVVFFVFTGAYLFTRMLAAKTVLDHAAARAARAKAVGFNRFMCEKSARSAAIPVSGRLLWPGEAGVDEVSRVPIYLASEDPARANGVLEYELWGATDIEVNSDEGVSPIVEAGVTLDAGDFSVKGSAKVESHYPYYMTGDGS